MSVNGIIFDIQGFSLHDGPGCRTLVFLSGCPMRCAWCSNPEGQLLRRRLMYHAQKCRPVNYHCVKACPHGAIHINPLGSTPLTFNRSLCDNCESMDCVHACLHEALKIAGHLYTVDELMRILIRDQGFWGEQGGVTFSGGEPLSQPEFILAVLERCRSAGMHTALETCAYVDTQLLMEILPWTDWLLIDLKHIDSAVHQAKTGVGNELILHNITTVAAAGWDGRLVIRVPVVPGFTDTEENFQAIAEFMKRLHLKEANLLPLHRLGSSKYQQLGLDYPYSHISPPSKEIMQTAQRLFTAAGLSCYVDFETPF